jgi:hypothetical protein
MILSDGSSSSSTIAYVPFDGRHKAKNLSIAIRREVEMYFPIERARFLITDGGSNIKAVAKDLNIVWYYCALHNFQRALVVITSRRTNKRVFATVRRFVSLLHTSSIALEALQQAQMNKDKKHTVIPADVCTRYEHRMSIRPLIY